jgi:hypothetical protein
MRKLSCSPEQLISECYNFPYIEESRTLRFGQYIVNKYGIAEAMPYPQLYYQEDTYKALLMALKNILENE